MVMNNLPIISPLTAEIIEKTDEAAAKAGEALMEADISNMSTMEIVKLLRPYYREAMKQIEQ